MATIWGTDPKTGKKNAIYAIHIPHNDVAEIIENGKRDGWTDLTTIWNPESRLLGQSEGDVMPEFNPRTPPRLKRLDRPPESSESSESEASTTASERSSATSVAASPVSATRSRTSPRKARRKR